MRLRFIDGTADSHGKKLDWGQQCSKLVGCRPVESSMRQPGQRRLSRRFTGKGEKSQKRPPEKTGLARIDPMDTYKQVSTPLGTWLQFLILDTADSSFARMYMR